MTKIDWNAIAKVGIPGVIAMFLVWKLSDGFELFDKRLQAVESQHSLMFNAMERTQGITERAYESNKQVLHVLRTMCVNDAKNAEARRLCLQE
jgi:hypothetical protein